MHIREERPGDAATITAIINAAFAPRTYDEATLAKIAKLQREAGIADDHKDPAASGLSEAQIIELLRKDSALTLSLIGEVDGELVAHVAFSKVRIGQAQLGWYGLGPVSVRPDLQGRGLGSLLIREGLSRLEALGAQGCVLLGYPPYYARFGFEPDGKLTYLGQPNPALQRLIFSGASPTGDVVYHRAFGTRREGC